MAWLLDTNFLSEGRKPRPNSRMASFYNAQPLDTLFISVVNVAEIRFGIELQQDPGRRVELEDWLELKLLPAFAGRILPMTVDILLRWRHLTEEGRKIGHTYSNPDLLIAATALHHGLTVVTRDRIHFDKAGVPVFNPWDTAPIEGLAL